MALEHEFVAIDEIDDIDNVRDYTAHMVKVPDAVIQYVADTFRWVKTYWTNEQEKWGLDYYGYTIIKGTNINKFKNIIDNWLQIFECAPESFYITGDYLLDENKYEKIELSKQEVLSWLSSLQKECIKAIEQEKLLLHLGI